MTARLEGRVALVTGAARGQGRSHAVRLASQGADVIAVDVCASDPALGYPLATRDDLDETARLVRAEGRRVHTAVADVTDRDQLEAVREATTDEFGRLDVIVANAATSQQRAFLDWDDAFWDRMVAVNLSGVFRTVQTFLPRMIDAGNGGSIVLISSVAGLKAVPYSAPYVAAKFGVQGLMEVLAIELGEHRIRVNTVCPGPIRTPMTTDESFLRMTRQDPSTAQLFDASFNPVLPMPDDGLLPPSVISDAVSWLAGDESAWVTGASIPVDAGVVVR